jgi:hypothetical protein
MKAKGPTFQQIKNFVARGQKAQAAVDKIIREHGSTESRPTDDEEEARPASISIRRCRVCGCTQSAACQTSRGPCFWVDADLCSAPSCGWRLVDVRGLRIILNWTPFIAHDEIANANRATLAFAQFDLQMKLKIPGYKEVNLAKHLVRQRLNLIGKRLLSLPAEDPRPAGDVKGEIKREISKDPRLRS